MDEVISTIERHPDVFQVTVIVSGESLDKQLVAYVAPHPQAYQDHLRDPSGFVTKLRQWLTERTPMHLVPALFMIIEVMPLTINGKVDRKALPVPQFDSLNAVKYVAPANETERILCQAWATGLGLDKVGVEDNFFAIGGDSIRVIRCLKLAEQQGVHLQVKDVFAHQTVALLAEHYINHGSQQPQRSEPAPLELIAQQFDGREYLQGANGVGVEDCYPVSAMQQAMLSSYFRPDVDKRAYHPYLLLRISGKAIDEARLNEAIKAQVAATPTFRSDFVALADGRYIQKVMAQTDVSLQVVDFSGYGEDEQQQALAQFIRSDRDKRFASGHSWLRFALIEYGKGHYGFYVSAFHGIFDGSGLVDSCAAIMAYYLALQRGVAHTIPQAENVFKQHLALELQSGASVEAQKAWQQLLSDYQPMPLLPLCERALCQNDERTFALQSQQVQQLMALARNCNVPLKTLLLYAFKKAIGTVFAINQVTVDVVTSGRSNRLSDPIGAIGLFWSLLPISSTLDAHCDEQSFLKTLGQQLLTCDSYALYPNQLINAQTTKSDDGSAMTWAAFNYVNEVNEVSETKQINDEPWLIELAGKSDRFDYRLKMKIDANTAQHAIAVLIEFDSRYLSKQQIASVEQCFTQAITTLINAQ